jgi:hypothetical protein
MNEDDKTWHMNAVEKIQRLKEYQPNAFPIKPTFELFLITMRVKESLCERDIFQAGSMKSVINSVYCLLRFNSNIKRNIKIVESKKHLPLTSDALSKAVKRWSERDGLLFSMRSFRTGYVWTSLRNDTLDTGSIKDGAMDAIEDYIGWRRYSSVPYKMQNINTKLCHRDTQSDLSQYSKIMTYSLAPQTQPRIFKLVYHRLKEQLTELLLYMSVEDLRKECRKYSLFATGRKHNCTCQKCQDFINCTMLTNEFDYYPSKMKTFQICKEARRDGDKEIQSSITVFHRGQQYRNILSRTYNRIR